VQTRLFAFLTLMLERRECLSTTDSMTNSAIGLP
jgi:hypothetical protein